MSYTTSKSSDYLPIYHPSLFNNPETQKLAQQSNTYASTISSSQSYSTIHSFHVGGSGSFSHYYFNSGGSSIVR